MQAPLPQLITRLKVFGLLQRKLGYRVDSLSERLRFTKSSSRRRTAHTSGARSAKLRGVCKLRLSAPILSKKLPNRILYVQDLRNRRSATEYLPILSAAVRKKLEVKRRQL